MKATATGLIPFVPAGSDFEKALAFFADIGFATTWRNGDIAHLRFGHASFLLQNIDLPVWQENQMHIIEVDDLDLYWSEIDALDLPSRYPGVKTKEPTDFPWGREVHIIDPGGVCWHFRKEK